MRQAATAPRKLDRPVPRAIEIRCRVPVLLGMPGRPRTGLSQPCCARQTDRAWPGLRAVAATVATVHAVDSGVGALSGLWATVCSGSGGGGVYAWVSVEWSGPVGVGVGGEGSGKAGGEGNSLSLSHSCSAICARPTSRSKHAENADARAARIASDLSSLHSDRISVPS